MKNLKDIRYRLNIQRFPYGAAPYSDKHVTKQCCTWRDLPCCFQYSSGLGHQQWMLSLTVSPPRRTTLMMISHFCLKMRVVVHVLLGKWYPPKDPDFFTNSCLIWAWLDSIATTRTFNSDTYRPWNVLVHPKKRATFMPETFCLNVQRFWQSVQRFWQSV